MRALRIALALILAAILAIGAAIALFLWATTPSASPGHVLLPPKTPYTKGSLFAYVQPWGGEASALTRRWSRYADNAVIDVKAFPDNTHIAWRWPPMAPLNDVGVWGYNAVMYGNYDGGVPEHPVTPIRVADLKTLHETFNWSIKNRFGDANVLTEFYLYSTATDAAVHTIEIGWYLHAPASTRQYFDGRPLVGLYVDENGRRWTVRMEGEFCMFSPERPGDVPSGSIDIKRALLWLQDKGRITGKEWVWGLAIGVEPVRGIGNFDLHQWHVVMN